MEPPSDYFDFFSLPRKLNLDTKDLESRFYALSKQWHPDRFARAGAVERRVSENATATLNDGYRTLKEPVSRAEYLLKQHGFDIGEQKSNNVPPELLEEVFELNMQVEELKAAKKTGDEDEVAEARSSLEEALAGLRKKLAGIDEVLLTLFEDWDSPLDRNAATDQKKPLLDRMSELLSHRSYVRHLVSSIQEEL
jgi:molecular chaperone HscB